MPPQWINRTHESIAPCAATLLANRSESDLFEARSAIEYPVANPLQRGRKANIGISQEYAADLPPYRMCSANPAKKNSPTAYTSAVEVKINAVNETFLRNRAIDPEPKSLDKLGRTMSPVAVMICHMKRTGICMARKTPLNLILRAPATINTCVWPIPVFRVLLAASQLLYFQFSPATCVKLSEMSRGPGAGPVRSVMLPALTTLKWYTEDCDMSGVIGLPVNDEMRRG